VRACVCRAACILSTLDQIVPEAVYVCILSVFSTCFCETQLVCMLTECVWVCVLTAHVWVSFMSVWVSSCHNRAGVHVCWVPGLEASRNA
jgi:hypothetical protein